MSCSSRGARRGWQEGGGGRVWPGSDSSLGGSRCPFRRAGHIETLQQRSLIPEHSWATSAAGRCRRGPLLAGRGGSLSLGLLSCWRNLSWRLPHGRQDRWRNCGVCLLGKADCGLGGAGGRLDGLVQQALLRLLCSRGGISCRLQIVFLLLLMHELRPPQLLLLHPDGSSAGGKYDGGLGRQGMLVRGGRQGVARLPSRRLGGCLCTLPPLSAAPAHSVGHLEAGQASG